MDLSLLTAKILPVLRKHQVTVCYLFGYHATGNDYEDSDVDLGLVFQRAGQPGFRPRPQGILPGLERRIDTGEVTK